MCAKVWCTIVTWTCTAKFQKVAGKCWKSLPLVVQVLVFYEVKSRNSLQQVAKIGKSSRKKCAPWCGKQTLPESKKHIFWWWPEKVPKFAFCGKDYGGPWFCGPWWVGPDKLMPSQTKPWGGTPGPKVPWVGQVCVFSDKACPRVQSSLAVLRERFRGWSSWKKCAPRSGAQLFPGHKLPSLKKWLGNYGKVCPWWLKCWSFTRFGVGLVSNEEKKLESLQKKMCIVVWRAIVPWEQKAYLLMVAWKLPKVAFCWKFTAVFSFEALTGRAGQAHALSKQVLGWDPRPKSLLGQTSLCVFWQGLPQSSEWLGCVGRKI